MTGQLRSLASRAGACEPSATETTSPGPQSMDKSEFLYLVRPTRPAMLTDGMTAAEESTLAAHFAYLRQLADQGIVRLAGRTQETGAQTFGIVVLRADTVDDAQRLVDADPAVAHRVMTAELFPFRIAIGG